MSDIRNTASALLLMDFQNAIVGILALDGPAVVSRARQAAEIARAARVSVMHVRVAFSEADYAAIPDRNKSFSALAGKRFLTDGAETAAIHDDIGLERDEAIFTKRRVGAFSTTKLATALAARGIDTLFLAGISTSGCVLSTLRDAADRDFRLFVLADCCGDPDAELHRVLTTKLFPRQADVIDLAAFRDLWR
jgi:nicotinamidase-related amidase